MTLQHLVIVTGMSGSGKGTVLKAFEDLGYICVDNLPVLLIPNFIKGFRASAGVAKHVALVVDIRAGEKLHDLGKTISYLKKSMANVLVIFLEARDSVLIRRFSETRRPHPLSAGRPLLEAIRIERKRLSVIAELADVTIDTSDFTVHQAKSLIMERFRKSPGSLDLNIQLLSFGYKHGLPLEADLVFDTRFLPNPHFVPRIKDLSGKDPKVVRYMNSFPETKAFVLRIGKLLKYLLPCYVREGKSYLTIAVGCTGGRHRSVYVAEALARYLKDKKWNIQIRHRDVNL